eukprot:gene3795-4376_t
MDIVILNKIGNKPPREVKQLVLDQKRIQKLADLKDFVELEILSLNNCSLQSIETLPTLPKLKKLELNDNRISGGMHVLTHFIKLSSLSLSGNQIKTLDELKPLTELPSLQYLDLYGCPVTLEDKYSEKLFSMMKSLVALDGYDSATNGDSGDSDQSDSESDDSDDYRTTTTTTTTTTSTTAYDDEDSDESDSSSMEGNNDNIYREKDDQRQRAYQTLQNYNEQDEDDDDYEPSSEEDEEEDLHHHVASDEEEEESLDDDEDDEDQIVQHYKNLRSQDYDLVRLVAPRVYGAMLTTTLYLCESYYLRPYFLDYLMRKNQFPELMAFDVGLLSVTPYPNVRKMNVDMEMSYATYSTSEFLNDKALASGELSEHMSANPNSAVAIHRTYLDGKTDPLRIAKTFVSVQKESDRITPPLLAFISVDEEDILLQARESAERWNNGQQKSILDGITISLKDVLVQSGHYTTCGTSFLSKIYPKAEEDSKIVADLRSKGAILVGKNNMHEIGISTLGYNTHFGFTRNAYNLNHYPGGSSSGSATSVAAGLNPISIGSDGGGSARIPASLCGVVGLKATYGRIATTGGFGVCYSVGHIGPIGASVIDTAIAYAAIAGKDDHDHTGLIQPDPILPNFSQIPTDQPLKGLRVGIFRAWFNDCTKEINDACNKSVALLEEQGATVVDISVSHLLYMRLAQGAIIISEMRNSMSKYFKDHLNEFHADTRITLSLMEKITGYDYLHCNRVRTYAINQFKEIFKTVDVIVTPTNGTLAPEIIPAVLQGGESNLTEVGKLMTFAFPGNLTGVPAISIPVGMGEKNLPIGIQFMGRWWEEDLLFHVAYVLEKAVQFNGTPEYWRPVLENQVE